MAEPSIKPPEGRLEPQSKSVSPQGADWSFLQEAMEIRNLLRSDGTTLGIVTGPRRAGKTTAGFHLGRLVDDHWGIDRVSWTGNAWIRAAIKAPKHSLLLLDEPVEGANRRRSMSNANVDLANFLTITGAKNQAGLIISPLGQMLDRIYWAYADFEIHLHHRGWAEWRTVTHREGSTDPVRRPKFYFPVEAAEGIDWDAYKPKKMDFVHQAGKEALARSRKAAQVDD